MLQQAALRGVHGLRLRNAGKNGARLGLNYVISGSPQDQVALIRARGPWQLIENRTSPHDIVPNRHQALKIGDGFAGLVHHPGTPGKHVWRDGTRRAESQLGRVYAKQMSAAISAAFKA